MTSNVETYKGYAARIEYDAQDGLFVGHIAGITDIVGFHAETVKALKDAFHEAVEDYVATCAKTGKEPQKPFSGNLMLRIAPEVHQGAALAAQLSGMSLNLWAEAVLRAAADIRQLAATDAPDALRSRTARKGRRRPPEAA